ncbi:MAG TPA: efflux RND transporter periplasmic adaptor subunit [Anaeromyxobacteraceae bacterium]|nr:efflux RND transporter periplasmic adaptor subunit [Anaeromyxobacteraceae bacterium]
MNRYDRQHDHRFILVLCSFLSAVGCGRSEPFLQGESDATRVDIASKVAGRVEKIHVREGDMVKRGQVLASLDGIEIRAKAAQALAAREAARAARDKAWNGSRQEEIRAARDNYNRAMAQAAIAGTTFSRLDRLLGEGVVPLQKRDEAEASFRAARDSASAARAQYDLALAGARSEDRAAAAAELQRAEGVVLEANSYVDDNELCSPVAGQVMVKVVEEGELVSPGLPVLTVVDLSDQWITVNVREDRLAGLKIGDVLSATLPALGSERHEFTVSYISPLGSFATWRATRETGGFDVRTFEVRARPPAPVDGLRPGMSALIRWPPARTTP